MPYEVDPRSHARLDLESRRLKAAKVARLLGFESLTTPVRILEIGCGSGGIASYLGTLPAGHEVHAVDVIDSRVTREGFAFQLVDGTSLPFSDEDFDVVLSNHVIEHVGDAESQFRHLREVRRVLKESGKGYLAVPNRWRLIEPHYRLPLLSVWPRSWRSPYLRLARKGTEYDCEPLSAASIERMFRGTGLEFERAGVQAARATLEIEWPHSRITGIVRAVPDGVLRHMEPLLATLIYRLRRAE